LKTTAHYLEELQRARPSVPGLQPGDARLLGGVVAPLLPAHVIGQVAQDGRDVASAESLLDRADDCQIVAHEILPSFVKLVAAPE